MCRLVGVGALLVCTIIVGLLAFADADVRPSTADEADQSQHWQPEQDTSLEENVPPYFQTLQTVRVDSDPSVEWLQFGPGMSGNSDRGYWHPTDPDWTYQGPNMGNAYFSSNRGTTYWGMVDYDATYNATQLGPIQIKAVGFSHQDENLGFCSSDKSEGMWMTKDKGRSWTYRYDLDATWNMSHINYIQADPTNDSIWYAGAGDAYYFGRFIYTSTYPHGTPGERKPPHEPVDIRLDDVAGTPMENISTSSIWRSMDRGETWSLLGGTSIPHAANIVRIAVNPLVPSHVFAATTYGLYKSIDHGDTWTLLHVDNDIVRDMDIRVDKINKKFEIYVLTLTMWEADGAGGVASKTGGIFKSVDEGVTWQSLVGDMHINMSLLATDYQVKWYYYQFLGIWFSISIDEAMKTYPNIPEHFLDGLVRVRVDPNNASRIYVMNDYKSQVSTMPVVMWCTHNGGVHWD
eukprot:scpid81641/ scgid23915/ 